MERDFLEINLDSKLFCLPSIIHKAQFFTQN